MSQLMPQRVGLSHRLIFQPSSFKPYLLNPSSKFLSKLFSTQS